MQPVRFTVIHAGHLHEQGHKRATEQGAHHGCLHSDTRHIGLVGASGMALHSFLDGAVIGLGFVVSVKVGIIIALAVIMHDFGDGLSTVTVMLRHKNSRARTLLLLFVDALAPVLGAFIAVNLSVPAAWLGVVLAFFAGFFLYLSTGDLLPEANENPSYAILGMTVLGALIVFGVTRLI